MLPSMVDKDEFKYIMNLRFCGRRHVSSNGPYGGVTLPQQPCCVVLVAFCLRRRRSPTIDESFVQGDHQTMQVEDIYINCLKLNLTYLKTPFLADLFFHMCRVVFLSWLQFVQCLCILFLFYLTVLNACMICFYYNVCDCHAFIKGNLLTYLLNFLLRWKWQMRHTEQ